MKRTLLCAALLTALSTAVPFLCLLFPSVPVQAAPTVTPSAAPTAAAQPESTAAPSAHPHSPKPSPCMMKPAIPTSPFPLWILWSVLPPAKCPQPGRTMPCWPRWLPAAAMRCTYPHRGRALPPTALCAAAGPAARFCKAAGAVITPPTCSACNLLPPRTGQTVLLYNGQPAAACYHAISSGHTEASQNVWGGQAPYLCGVDSAWDKFADGYEVTIQYSAEQVRTALEELGLTPMIPPKVGSVLPPGTKPGMCARWSCAAKW